MPVYGANMASALNWIPDTLYNTAIAAVAANYTTYQRDLRVFDGNVLFDIYYKLYKEGRLCQLGCEISSLDIFVRLLKVSNKRYLLHHCFQAVMDHGSATARELANSYKLHCSAVRSNSMLKNRAIQVGLMLSEFLSDAGWFVESERTSQACLELCKTIGPFECWSPLSLGCYARLLHAQTSYCKFREADQTYDEAKEVVERLQAINPNENFSELFRAFSALFFHKSDYNQAYEWSDRALKQLSTCKSPRAIVTVLRQASKACVVKRHFKQAEALIKQAMLRAREYFGNRHPVMADTLADYGFYLLNVDSICQCIKVYHMALENRQCLIGGQNLLVAISHEDLAYALYIHEYSTGSFKDAREHTEKALTIMHNLLPENHLLIASSKRVKALVLEEIAVDNMDKAAEKRLLLEAQELHVAALHLAQDTFGENNLQTAKHYGNLGRLYQSMRQFEEARKMHLKAIRIKEEILGSDDYEIALSIGHLASLYNYDMMLFNKAEELHLRAIKIGINVFGEAYSGLEFDYRGLLRVYTSLGNEEKASKYLELLHNWKILRDELENTRDTSPLEIDVELIDIDKLYDMFLCTDE